MTLNGKVIPKDAVSESPGFASGSATLTAAGTAMQEADAASIMSSKVPPNERPIISANNKPTAADMTGKTTPKPSKRQPNKEECVIRN